MAADEERGRGRDRGRDRASRARGRRSAGASGAGRGRCRARSGTAWRRRSCAAWKPAGRRRGVEHAHVRRAAGRSGRARARRAAIVARAASKDATWPRAWTPASVRPAPATAHAAAAVEAGQRLLQRALDGAARPAPRLRLPAREVGAVVGEGDAEAHAAARPGGREPGFTGLRPRGAQRAGLGRIGRHLQREQAARGTPRSSSPALRSTRQPTASTRAPRGAPRRR